MDYCRKYLDRFNKILENMSNEMLSNEVTGNITIDFIRCMIPHHMAAIYMSQNLLEFTCYEPLKNIANNIIKIQTQGIEEMKYIANTTPYFLNDPNDVRCYNEKYLEITKRMICRMRNSPRCRNINVSFIGEMVPHHEGAIQMCENVLKYQIDNRLRNVAENIIKEQTRGVEELMQIRRCLCRRR